MKKLQKILFVFICICMFWIVSPTVLAETNQQEVTIYGLRSEYADVVTIPGNALQSYQINVGAGQAVSYYLLEGDSVKVSDTGCITPKYTYWKKGNGFSYSVDEDEEYDYFTMDEGNSTVAAVTDGVTYIFNVHAVDYSEVYCSEVMDAYISSNISDDMTDLEFMKAICRFAAGYDYSVYYSNARDMIILGGGDCWASVDATLLMCEKLGIKAWMRYAHNDPGAGSGHRNVVAQLNGKYYELDAGYYSSKGEDGYRYYSVKEKSSLFSYTTTTEGAVIYQYDGNDNTGKLEIPETIDGKKVVGITKVTPSINKFTEIVLPDTLISIGDSAFSSCRSLTTLHIPASLESIGITPFLYCAELQNITVASSNANYKAEDGVLYSIDGTKLLAAASVSQVVIPETVTEIGEYAFYNCSKLVEVTIPSGVTTIGNYAFSGTSALSSVHVPSSITSIGKNAFAYSKMEQIYFSGNAPSFDDSAFKGTTVEAYYPVGDSTWTEAVLSNYGGTITWNTWNMEQVLSIEDATVTLEQTEYKFSKKYFKPAVTVTLGDSTLTENVDYVVTYENNYNVGTANVVVVGIGNYKGVVKTSFTITKAEQTAQVRVESKTIAENSSSRITYVSGAGGQTYSSSDVRVATVDAYGVIYGVGAGEATITVQIPEDECYYATTTSFKVTVTHDFTNAQVIDATVVDGTIQIRCMQCHRDYAATVPTSVSVLWGETGSNFYSSIVSKDRKIGDEIRYYIDSSQMVDFPEIEVLSEHPEVAVVDAGNKIRFISAGTANILVRPKYNPEAVLTYVFTVAEEATVNDEETSQKPEDVTTEDTDTSENIDITNTDTDINDKTDVVVATKWTDPVTGFFYEINTTNDTEVTLVFVNDKSAKRKVTIPATVTMSGKTYKVTAIGKNAFKGCKNLKTVVIGKNVTKIGEKAFYGCKKIKTITIKTSRLKSKAIGKKAFSKTPKNMSIKVPKKKFKAYKSLLIKSGVNKKAKFKR